MNYHYKNNKQTRMGKIISFLFSFYYMILFYGDLGIIDAKLISLLICFIILFLRRKSTVIVKSKYIYIIYVLILFMSISILWSNAPIYGLKKLMLVFISIILTIVVSNELNIREFIKFNFLFGVLFLIILIHKYGWYPTLLSESSFYRLGRIDDNPNIIGRGLGFYIINTLLYLSVIKRNKYINIISIINISLLFVYLLLTGSKGPLFSMIITLLIVIMYYKKKVSVFIIGVFILTIIGYYLITNVEYLSNRMIQDTSSYSGRSIIYKTAIREYLKGNSFKILMGSGMGNYGYFIWKSDVTDYPHNIFIEILYESGLIGISLFIIIISITIGFWKDINYSDKANVFIISFIYFLLCAQVSSDIGANALVFSTPYIVTYFKLQKNQR